MMTETLWPTKPKILILRLYTVFQPFCDITVMHFECWHFFMNKKAFSFIGLCVKKQKEITKAIKRAQILGKSI